MRGGGFWLPVKDQASKYLQGRLYLINKCATVCTCAEKVIGFEAKTNQTRGRAFSMLTLHALFSGVGLVFDKPIPIIDAIIMPCRGKVNCTQGLLKRDLAELMMHL